MKLSEVFQEDGIGFNFTGIEIMTAHGDQLYEVKGEPKTGRPFVKAVITEREGLWELLACAEGSRTNEEQLEYDLAKVNHLLERHYREAGCAKEMRDPLGVVKPRVVEKKHTKEANDILKAADELGGQYREAAIEKLQAILAKQGLTVSA